MVGILMARWWIFRADPARYDLPRALNVLSEILWPVVGAAGGISPGDTVMLWSDKPAPGIYGVATVTAPPSPTMGPEFDPFWLTEPAAWGVYCPLRVDRSLSGEPVLADELDRGGALDSAAARGPIDSVTERHQVSLTTTLATRGWTPAQPGSD